MKIKFLFTLLALSSAIVFSYADGPGSPFEKCGFVRNLDRLKSSNPLLEQQIIQDESNLQLSIANGSLQRSQNSVYTVPVVVHVVYQTTGQNISDAQILSQIDALNEDYARMNADKVNSPSAFGNVASSTNFQFCLAQQDPNGGHTNGIERRQTSIQGFDIDDAVKSFSSGGLNAWDVNSYLNIWVCNLNGNILGYGEIPSSVHSNTYGVVVHYSSFGRTGVVSPPYNKGRTCTHEISHCFRLYHIWGDDATGSCSGTDYVNDTPNQANATFGCYNYPHTDNCSPSAPGIMFMNYMDYSDDDCMNMFTANQASRMYAAISAFYPSLLNSHKCLYIGIDETSADFQFSIYPNPSSGIINIDMFTTKYIGSEVNVRVTDVLGKTVSGSIIKDPNSFVHQLDLSLNENGIYFVNIFNDRYNKTERIILNR